MTWTLTYNNETKALHDWGLSSLKRIRINQGIDKVFISSPTTLGNESIFKPESFLTISKNNVPWFCGLITKTPGWATSRLENQLYELSGPWWYLENLIYQQGWIEAIPKGETQELRQIDTGRIILGQNFQGTSIHNGEQITEILQYAIGQGAPFTIGDISLDIAFPSDETKDISCAEAIQRLLRWSPDAIVWFDYRTLPLPTIHIKRRHQMVQTNLSLNEYSSIKSLKITPRYDLKSSAVVIKYEKLHQTNGQTWISTQVDAFPPNATGKEFKALVLTIELDGAKTQTVSQYLRTEPILLDSPLWWQKHLPALHTIPLENIIISSPSRTGSLPAELIEGSISPWMQRDVEEDIIRAKLSYETENEQVVNREVAIKIHTTNASTRVYQQIIQACDPEPTPQLLAQKLYQAVSELQVDGEITLENCELDSSPIMGSVLNIYSGNKSWETMCAPIQSLKEDLDKGQTTITFGPAKHLGPDDLVELLRTNRKRQATRNAARRITGKPSKSNDLIQSTHSRIENTHSGTSNFSRLIVSNKDDTAKRIIIDANRIKENTFLELREEDYCFNGILKKRLILASPPYTPTEMGVS